MEKLVNIRFYKITSKTNTDYCSYLMFIPTKDCIAPKMFGAANPEDYEFSEVSEEEYRIYLKEEERRLADENVEISL